MKLIIDIDDEQVLFDIKNRGLESETETDKVIINALYDGIPLDDVKAEIDQYLFQNEFGLEYRKEVLQIFDNIGKAESQKLADDIGFLNQSLEDAIDCSDNIGKAESEN